MMDTLSGFRKMKGVIAALVVTALLLGVSIYLDNRDESFQVIPLVLSVLIGMSGLLSWAQAQSPSGLGRNTDLRTGLVWKALRFTGLAALLLGFTLAYFKSVSGGYAALVGAALLSIGASRTAEQEEVTHSK